MAAGENVMSAHQIFHARRTQQDAGERCDQCGQFVSASGSHSCVQKMGIGKQALFTSAPALLAAATFTTTAVALAVGPVAMGIVAVGVALSFGVKSLIQRRAKDALWRSATDDSRPDRARSSRSEDEQQTFEFAESTVRDLATRMNVPGEVSVMERKSGTPAAVRLDNNRSVVLVTPGLLEMPRDEMTSILAHEVAHLQREGTSAVRGKRFFAVTAFPVAFGAAAVSGLAALPAAAIAAGVWYGSKAASSAISRREERRADRVAYALAGETYASALTRITRESGPIRRDLPWRAEDIVFTHGNLPNRLDDMRAP